MNVVLRGVGPALAGFGVSDALNSPDLSLYDGASSANLITMDTAWQSPPSVPGGFWLGKATPEDATAADFTRVGAFPLPPGSSDTAIRVGLPAGAYTTQIAETGFGAGVALAEIYDEDLGNHSAQLINVSSRAFVAGGDDALIAGFVISGSTAQTVLLRASGPALGVLGVSDTLSYPELQLFDANQDLVAANNGWGGNAQVAGVAARVGAFAWSNPSSADSAILVTLPPGNYTAQVVGADGNAGVALIEAYAVP